MAAGALKTERVHRIASTHLSVTDMEEIMRLHVLYKEKYMIIYVRVQEEEDITLVKYGIASW